MKSYRDREDERRRRRNNVILAVVISSLLIFSTIAAAISFFGGDSQTIKYNGYKIKREFNAQGIPIRYTTEVNDTDVSFYSAPTDSLDIALPADFVPTLQEAQAVVIIFDPEDNFTAIYDELRLDFSSALPVTQYAAVTEPSDIYRLPVLTCGNASAEIPFIYLKEGQRSIEKDGFCYVVTGTQYDFALLRDRVVYAYHGITTP